VPNGLLKISLFLQLGVPIPLTQPLHRIQCAGDNKEVVQQFFGNTTCPRLSAAFRIQANGNVNGHSETYVDLAQ
jgi:hypothetical protein